MKKEFKFDKFIKDIQKRESSGRERVRVHQEGQADLPQRKYNELYREDWRNRTYFRGDSNE